MQADGSKARVLFQSLKRESPKLFTEFLDREVQEAMLNAAEQQQESLRKGSVRFSMIDKFN